MIIALLELFFSTTAFVANWGGAAFRALSSVLRTILFGSLALVILALVMSYFTESVAPLLFLGILHIFLVAFMLFGQRAFHAALLALLGDVGKLAFTGRVKFNWPWHPDGMFKYHGSPDMRDELSFLEFFGKIVFWVVLIELFIILICAVFPVWIYPAIPAYLIIGLVLWTMLQTTWGKESHIPAMLVGVLVALGIAWQLVSGLGIYNYVSGEVKFDNQVWNQDADLKNGIRTDMTASLKEINEDIRVLQSKDSIKGGLDPQEQIELDNLLRKRDRLLKKGRTPIPAVKITTEDAGTVGKSKSGDSFPEDGIAWYRKIDLWISPVVIILVTILGFVLAWRLISAFKHRSNNKKSNDEKQSDSSAAQAKPSPKPDEKKSKKSGDSVVGIAIALGAIALILMFNGIGIFRAFALGLSPFGVVGTIVVLILLVALSKRLGSTAAWITMVAVVFAIIIVFEEQTGWRSSFAVQTAAPAVSTVSDNTSAEPFKDHCGEVRKIKAEDLMSSDKIERWIDTECFMRPGRTFVFRIMPGSPGITRRPGPYEGELMFPSIKPMTIMGWIGRTNYVTEFENNMKFTSEEVAKEGGPEYGPIRVTVNILEKKPGDIPADSERRDLRGEIWYRIEVS